MTEYKNSVTVFTMKMGPKPNKEGIWEWFDESGNRRLVDVVNVEHDPSRPPYLRVAWWGGYYNITPESHDLIDSKGKVCGNYTFPAEWADRWGTYVGPRESIPNDQLYTQPSPVEMEILRRKDNT